MAEYIYKPRKAESLADMQVPTNGERLIHEPLEKTAALGIKKLLTLM